MTVDIWSDVRCPFCYIGKRRFEKALDKFDNKEEVNVVWHSFQLDPNLKTQPETTTLDYFKQVKNVSEEQALEMFKNVEEMAAETGLEMKPNSSVVANSFKAHLLLQLAKTQGVANKLKEELFEAQFSEGRNIDDEDVLISIAGSVGISEEEVRGALNSKEFAQAVKQDELQAQQIGVRGVPFFVFENKYGVSGAQASATFLEVLEKVQGESNP